MNFLHRFRYFFGVVKYAHRNSSLAVQYSESKAKMIISTRETESPTDPRAHTVQNGQDQAVPGFSRQKVNAPVVSQLREVMSPSENSKAPSKNQTAHEH